MDWLRDQLDSHVSLGATILENKSKIIVYDM